jgi:hypothetical protein
MPGTYRLKLGAGKHYILGRSLPLLPGEEITCDEGDIEAFMDKFEVVVAQEHTEPTEGLRIEHRGGGWFDVVNSSTSKPINAKPMRHDDALALVNGTEES